MSAATFLLELNELDIRVSLDGNQLRCAAASGVMTPELRERLRQRKSEIVEFLR